MIGIKVQIVRFISKNQPGFVECKFKDAWDEEFVIEEKIPIVTAGDLNEFTSYPQDGVITCQVINEWTDKFGRRLVKIGIDKPLSIATIDGLTEFDVLYESLTEI